MIKWLPSASADNLSTLRSLFKEISVRVLGSTVQFVASGAPAVPTCRGTVQWSAAAVLGSIITAAVQSLCLVLALLI